MQLTSRQTKTTTQIRVGDYELTIWQGLSGIDAIRKEWVDLLPNVKNLTYYQCPGYFSDFLNSLASADDSIYFVTLRYNYKLVGVLPLHYKKRKVCKKLLHVLELPYNPHMTLAAPIFDERLDSSKAMLLIKKFLAKQNYLIWDLLLLSHIQVPSNLVDHLMKKRSLLLFSKFCRKSNYIACNYEYNLYAEKLSGNFRRNLRRLRRRALEIGRLEYKVYLDHEDLELGFNQFVQIEASGWKGDTGKSSALLFQQDALEFYRKRLKEEYGSKCRINVLYLDDRCIAAHYSILSNNTMYLLKIAYDISYSNLGPGNLLLESVIKDCFEDENIQELSFVTSPEWSSKWHPMSRSVLNIYIFNHTLRGYISALFSYLRTRSAIF